MAKRLLLLIALLLVVYSAILIGVEVTTSQDFVRHYMTDIEGPVPFFAINTTICVFLLWATALTFVICLFCIEPNRTNGRLTAFYLSQVFVFTYLGFDDRFKVHEAIGRRLDIGDHYTLIVVAVLQLACLVFLGGRHLMKSRACWFVVAAALLTGVMLAFDTVVPHDMLLRLTIEDLAKTWAALGYFLFGLTLLREHIDGLKLAAQRARRI